MTALALLPYCSTKPVDPSDLAAPPRGQGFQLRTGAFPVPPGTEEQDCFFFKVRDLAATGGLDPNLPVNLHRVVVAQKAGSHHMNLFRVRTIAGLDPANGAVQHGTNGQGECFKSSNWADWPLVANTQTQGVDWTFPDGVANVFQPDEWLMLQTHYVNATTQKSPEGVGDVAVNFFAIPREQVKAELGTVFATKQSIRICKSNPTPSFSGACQFGGAGAVTVIGANAHFHSRGKEFEIFAWDGKSVQTPSAGARLYQSKSWSDPPMLHSPELSTSIPPGGGIFYTCGYVWAPPNPSLGCPDLDAFDAAKYQTPADQLDCCYTFGPIVEKNEHCNAFVYYYPKQDDVNCF